MSCNYDKPKPNPGVLFQAKIFCSDRMKMVGSGDLICFLCATFETRLSAIVYIVTPEESHKTET